MVQETRCVLCPSRGRINRDWNWIDLPAHALSKDFETWLDQSQKTTDSQIKAIICPHAGYAYCGSTAAHSYHHVDPSTMLSPLSLSLYVRCEMNQCPPAPILSRHLIDGPPLCIENECSFWVPIIAEPLTTQSTSACSLEPLIGALHLETLQWTLT